VPWIDRYVITASVKEIPSGTRSQGRLMSDGVMCSDRRIIKLAELHRSEQIGDAG